MYMMDESRAHSCPAVPQDLGSGMSNSRAPCVRSLKEPLLHQARLAVLKVRRCWRLAGTDQ